MTLFFIRVFFLIVSCVVGYYVGILLQEPVLGLELGCLSGLVLIFMETRLHKVSVRGLPSMVFGLLLGVFMAKLLSDIVSLLPVGEFIHSVTRVILTLVFSYLGAVMALRGKDEFNIIIPYVMFKRQKIKEGIILLDTSAIIDGRISDIYKVNFMQGRLVIPRFVLQELQKISDSADDVKRQRGRRGVELLRNMQNDPNVDIHMEADELTEGQGADMKLIELAKLMDAKICTTDFNLSRIASLQGVEVLNIHELVNAVKPIIFSGEALEVNLLKDGKEPGQAIGYMEDGTMIVVEGANNFIGQNVKIKVTSILQTQSGKMIFAELVGN